jgi:hypothetical protein
VLSLVFHPLLVFFHLHTLLLLKPLLKLAFLPMFFNN